MEVLEPSLQMWFTFAIIAVGIFFYILDKFPMEITSLGIISSLLVLFHAMPLTGADGELLLNTKMLLSGFADPALITILALLVVGHGMVETGALDSPVKVLVRLGNDYPITILVLSLITVMVISAFLNNTPVVVIFIPIMITLVENLGKSPSLYLMPLSFVAILGGMTTLIGSSTNLLVAGSYESIGGDALGFFDFAVPGLFLATIGFLYVLFIAPRILPSDRSSSNTEMQITGKQFIVQIDLTDGNSLIGKKAVAGMFPTLAGLTVQMINRGTECFLPPFDDITLEKGDQIVIATTRKSLTEKITKDPMLLADVKNQPLVDLDDDADQKTTLSRGQTLVEVIVAPKSRLDGRTLAQAGFVLQGGCKILGVQRRSRMNRTSLNDIRIEANDTLLVLGNQNQIQSLRLNNDVMLLEWSVKEIPIMADMWKALGIFLGVVVLASGGLMPIAIAATLGAFAMIITGCLNVRKAAHAIDRNIFMLIGAALAMGTSLQMTGGASYLAMAMLDLLDGASTMVVLSAFFLLIAFLTNILSNNATAVLFTPIAVNVAQELGVDPFIFITVVIFAANCSFATPMGYQTNLLVLAPGNYKFSDFLKVGVPLILLLWICYTFFAPWYFGI
ncbi:SLC13 family permease [Pseudemcibacter aquimaris]|uniref:SLC13 family permease n=1 Tax=Pseudemcibacter aquimaris TaxID=2857064 RepID=UPI002010EA26|nr:SLC13 family permease [Pseudemcibacter aquimaris]MCC3860587.1 SLC13 family permease [Pseudemcibacter aquimaris]WDU59408.1 SLC13 family permease [Pseudemcibacter aquimaris]